MNIYEALENCEMNTPYYCFDAGKFRENMERIRNLLNPDIKICYSLKSNPFLAGIALEKVDYVEVCSEGELSICEMLDINRSRIVIGGIYKSEQMLKSIVDNPTGRISIESVTQLRILSEYAIARKKRIQVLLRVSSGNQFGIGINELEQIVRDSSDYPGIEFIGIHLYSSTQKRDIKLIEKDFALLYKAIEVCKIPDPIIEYGPGIGTVVFENQKTEWQKEIIDYLVDACIRISNKYPLTLEMGRLLTTDVGYYVTKIVDKKVNEGRTFYIVDGGIHHLNYYGQIDGFPKPYVRMLKEKSDKCEEVILCGALCTAHDILANKVILPAGEVGDRLIFENCGAYSVTEARMFFLSHPLPEIAIMDVNGLYTVRHTLDTYRYNTIAKDVFDKLS